MHELLSPIFHVQLHLRVSAGWVMQRAGIRDSHLALPCSREGLETEVIHMMFCNEVYVVALGPSFITPAIARETYCVQCIHLRATPITESHAP